MSFIGKIFNQQATLSWPSEQQRFCGFFFGCSVVVWFILREGVGIKERMCLCDACVFP